MRRAKVSELKARLSSYLADVRGGESVLVCDRNTPIARLVEDSIGVVGLTRTVLLRAALPMATPVRTLDAIHLASALMLRERLKKPLVFATHDAQQALAARTLGFRLVGRP